MFSKNPKHFAFLLGIPLLALLLLRWYGYDGLYGMDSYEYLRYTNSMRDFFLGGAIPGDFFWPKGYPILGGLVAILLPTSFALQIVSLAALYGTYYFCLRMLRLFNGEQAYSKHFLLLAVLISPYFLRSSIQCMSDILAVFCVTAAAFYSLQYSKNYQTKALIGAAFFATYAVFCRYGSAIPILPLVLFTIFHWFKKLRWKQLIALVLPALLIILHLYLETDSSAFAKHHFLEEWSFLNYFERYFPSSSKHNLAALSYPFPNIFYYGGLFFHPGFLLLNAPLLLVFLIYRKEYWKKEYFPLVVAVLLNLLFLAGVTFQGDRYLFPCYPLFVVLLFVPFLQLIQKLKGFKNAAFSLILALQLILFVRAVGPTVERNSLEQKVVERLQEEENRQTLYIFEMDLAMQNRGLDFNYENLWFKEYDQFKKGALVLFNPTKFAPRFEGKPPMNNWNRIIENHPLDTIANFEKGWNLYRIGE